MLPFSKIETLRARNAPTGAFGWLLSAPRLPFFITGKADEPSAVLLAERPEQLSRDYLDGDAVLVPEWRFSVDPKDAVSTQLADTPAGTLVMGKTGAAITVQHHPAMPCGLVELVGGPDPHAFARGVAFKAWRIVTSLGEREIELLRWPAGH